MKISKTKTISVMTAIAISVAGILFCEKALKKLKPKHSIGDRYKAYYLLAFDWLAKKNEYNDFVELVSKYFRESGLEKIAIYGSGSLGELFYNEIKGSDIKIAYFIDKNAGDIYLAFDNIPLTDLEGIERQEDVDAIVVTPIYDFNQISEELINVGCNLKIISLEDIIYAL